MKKSHEVLAALTTVLLAFTVSLFSGCETESADSAKITVKPSSATLSAANASVALSVSGGWSYSWSLSDKSIGMLNKTTGESVLYTATSFSSNTTQVVTVSASGLTNSVNASATVTILQVSNSKNKSSSNSGTGGTTNTTNQTSALTVSKEEAVLSTNTPSVKLKASGGSGEYKWSIKTSEYGSLSADSGATVIYTAAEGALGNTIAKTQIVTVKDKKDGSSSLDILIIQQ